MYLAVAHRLSDLNIDELFVAASFDFEMSPRALWSVPASVAPTARTSPPLRQRGFSMTARVPLPCRIGVNGGLERANNAAMAECFCLLS